MTNETCFTSVKRFPIGITLYRLKNKPLNGSTAYMSNVLDIASKDFLIALLDNVAIFLFTCEW